MFKNPFIIKVTSLILAIFIIFSLYLFVSPLRKSSQLKADTMEFGYEYDDSDSGFIDANLLGDENKLVANNDNFELYLNQTNSHFYIKDLTTNEIISSNPQVDDPAKPIPSIVNKQNATLEYRYFSTSGATSSGENYTKSIYHPESPGYEEGYRTFKLKEIKDGFQVFYRITDLEIDHLYFPKYLEPEVFEPILEDRSHPARRDLVNAYWDVIDKATGKYAARNYEGMSGTVRNRLYQIFYVDEVFGEYSREQSIEENALNGYFEVTVKFGFDIAIQVLLTKDGLEIKVINESITEYSKSKLADISVYPYFGASINIDPETKLENTGYLVIPDGSGAILEFNNGKTAARSYSKRLYGRDLAVLPYEMPEEQERILIPLYGVVKENIGFAAIITEGDPLATINANVSGISDDSYNKIYTNFKLREYENSIIGSGWNTYRLNIWTKDIVKTDFNIKYKILTGEDNNYVGVANAYKEYLIKEKGLVVNNEIDNKVIIELLGAFDKQKFFLGVPYTSMSSLTTYKEASLIVDELNDLGVDNLDIIFRGITNGGLDNGLENKVKFERKVGTKRQFERFEKAMLNQNINVYPIANFISTDDYNKLFEKDRYTSNRIKGGNSILFDYNIPTRLPNSELHLGGSNNHYVINPQYYNSLYQKYSKSYLFNNLLLEGIGSNLAGNYKRGNVIYLNESLLYQEETLENIYDKQNIAISEPLGFSYPYLDLAVDLPMESTLYTVLDYRIPLVQLVLSGVLNYSHNSINLTNKRDVDYQFLKALENGASLKYTLSYKNSLILLEKEGNEYVSTEYVNWLNTIKEQYQIIVENDLINANIVNHQKVANNVFKTTYSNGVVIFTNYNLSSVNVEGQVIEKINFLVVRG